MCNEHVVVREDRFGSSVAVQESTYRVREGAEGSPRWPLKTLLPPVGASRNYVQRHNRLHKRHQP